MACYIYSHANIESSEHFLDPLTNFIESFSETYDDFANMDDFKMQPTDRCSKGFMR